MRSHAARRAPRTRPASSPTRSCRSRSTDGIVDADGCIRPETTAEVLAGLKPAFDKDGTVTAGTSSPLTDGAAAVLVCSEEYADAHGLDAARARQERRGRGCAPEIMGIGPVAATQKGAGARRASRSRRSTWSN